MPPTECKQTATDKLQVRPEPTRPRQLTRTLSKMGPRVQLIDRSLVWDMRIGTFGA